MSNNLRDQLLGLGFKETPKELRKSKSTRPNKGKASGKKPAAKAKQGSEMDLAKAYAMRSQTEKREAEEARRLKEAEASERKRALRELETFLDGKALNAESADIARHFEYGGKIKRIYVTADQLKQVNDGTLGVVQLKGKMFLLTRAQVEEAEGIFGPSKALLVNPDDPVADDPYGKPEFQVPDDLVW